MLYYETSTLLFIYHRRRKIFFRTSIKHGGGVVESAQSYLLYIADGVILPYLLLLRFQVFGLHLHAVARSYFWHRDLG